MESEFVHKVYNTIAPHFSETRYKAWPVIENFLKSQPIGSLGGDIGCGNGKYFNIRNDVNIIGCDRSENLIKIANQRRPFTFVCDALNLPFKSDIFDFVISIAVIHHFSTAERRRKAIEEILRVLRCGGEALIFVWAFEQEGKRKFAEQDCLVPWRLQKQFDENGEEKVLQRYYHLFKKDELHNLVEAVILDNNRVKILETGYDRDNWFIRITKE
ncbi:S-adenosyl-L-methionine-dependent methyltransferase [Rozella allomycis CSF55]|uniref:S-adenosyl-L-methionine-dependent methyltransferase n=1 Tax=Rozella allomycis (strain CSF55) TaxID=988480 RepID=A0A075AYM1_ROZAC|nr:hypothetical protein O9G_003679 [Rozella allomycis CSF55]RKP20407.1 S-adenosyl-L-methionine-dependent methyltransferase [Rozella allomycis CSF55]|eukprot:EPZ35420.1 hypothetical protein O9G_003679 [Rozella allomycis CSF55]